MSDHEATPQPIGGSAAQRALERPMTKILAGAVAIALVLRLPWWNTPLGNDEGGLAFVARTWGEGGDFAYGPHFVDRPPLLLGLFRGAIELAGETGVRLLGALAAAALVAAVALVARELGGARAAGWAAVLTAAFASSVAIEAVYTPAELLGAVPATLAVLLLVAAGRRTGWDLPRSSVHGRESPALGLLCGAGALSTSALLIKQSFIDPLFAALGLFIAAAVMRAPRRALLRAAGAYLAGALIALAVGLAVWAGLSRGGEIGYAFVGFRLDGLGALAGDAVGLTSRLERLALPLLGSGIVLVLGWSIAGMASLKARPLLRATLAAWLLGGLVGVLAGGSYWPHYLIQLVPPLTVSAAVALAGMRARLRRRVAQATVIVVGALAMGGSIAGGVVLPDQRYQAMSYEIGRYLRKGADRGQTAYVMYAQPNILYYSRLESPFPYHWSLMMRSIPEAQARLRKLLASPRRPTWVVEWDDHRHGGLDRSGETARLLREHYRRVATVCDRGVLLERGVRDPRVPAPPARRCEEPPFSS